MTDMGTLIGSNGYTQSDATDINAAGQVAGSSDATNGTHAFITGPHGVGMTNLHSLGGGESEAMGLNAIGQVVGESTTADRQRHAFMTGPDGVGMADLNSLVHLPAGVVLMSAVGINNMGQVIALSAVPEPESYALMLAGLVLMGVMVRRKQKG